MDNVDVAIDSLARVDDDSKPRVTEETERGIGSEDRGDLATSGGTPQVGLDHRGDATLCPGMPDCGHYPQHPQRSSDSGLTGIKRVFLAPGTLLGDTTTDLYSLREDVDLLLTTFYLFLAFMLLMFIFRR